MAHLTLILCRLIAPSRHVDLGLLEVPQAESLRGRDWRTL